MNKEEVLAIEDIRTGDVIDVIKSTEDKYICVGYRGNTRYKEDKETKTYKTFCYLMLTIDMKSNKYRKLSRLEKELYYG